MAEQRPGAGDIDPTPGLAGGPGPTPPGVEDGTAVPRTAEPEPSGAEEAPPAEADREAGEAAERSAGVRRAEIPGLAGEREGRGVREDPAVEEQERRTRR
jgi:hypothetical protein